jgi:hypothetical protein
VLSGPTKTLVYNIRKQKYKYKKNIPDETRRVASQAPARAAAAVIAVLTS